MTRLLLKPLFIVFLLALFLRIYQLGSFPIGFHADEVRVAWNAKSILYTLHDDFGNFFPLYYNTFGDYRPTGIFYITIPSVALFGNSEFATRLPSALFGAFTVFPFYFFVKNSTKKKSIALLSGFFLAIVPWHVVTSRATSEVVISTFFTIGSLFLLEKAILKKSRRYLFFCFLAILIAYLFYHSIRVLAPIYLLTYAASKWKEIKKVQLTKPVVYLIFASVLLTIFFTFSSGGKGRLSQVSIANSSSVKTEVLGVNTESTTIVTRLFQNKFQIYIQNILNEYTSYFSPQFLIGENAFPSRYKIPGIGLISIPIFILFLVGATQIFQKKFSALPLYFLLISPVAAMITHEDSPNLNRAFLMLPFILIIAAYGCFYLRSKYRLLYHLAIFFCLASLLNMWVNFTSFGGKQMSVFRSPATKELSLYLNELNSEGLPIYVTNDPDSPYPWFAYFNKLDPREFNTASIKRTLGDWQYKNIIWTQNKCPAAKTFEEAKKNLQKVIVVNNGECSETGFEKEHPQANVIKHFTFYPSKTAYTVWEYDPRSK